MKAKGRKRDRRKNKGIVLAQFVVYLTGAVTLLMILYIGCLSLFSVSDLTKSYGGVLNPGVVSQYASFTVIPEHLSITQYRSTLWNNSDFWYYFWNSVKISLPVTLAVCLTATCGGYAFARFLFPGKKALLFLVILFMMIPSQVMIPSQFRLMYEMGLLNSTVSVILPNVFAPFGVYLMYQYALKLPGDIFEAAAIDGAGELRIFFSVVLPDLISGIAALFLLTVIDAWNFIEQPLVFFLDPFRLPLSAAMNRIGEARVLSLCAGCIVFVIPVFLVFLLGKDRLVEGIGQSVIKADSSVKGRKG